ncbi:MAG: family 16 glycosylhydrolase [Planctomycetaceae bacterium]|nr:family 16 glycosylhydrolase [Planctomycetaceae bacterium]
MKKLFLLLIGVVMMLNAAGLFGQTPYSAIADAEKDVWMFVWGDEFDGTQIDSSKWIFETGGAINNEAQLYTTRKENARLEDGNLVIEARKEKYTAPDGRTSDYTSACLTTCKIENGKWKPLFGMKYGRIEIRAKLPTGRGVWPALWLLELPAEPKDSWQRCGEIDMMEYVGHSPDTVHANLHNWDEHAEYKRHSFGNYLTKETPYDGFHTYWMEWSPELIEIFYDTKKIVSYRPDPEKPERFPYNKPHYLLMNLAIGGSWGGEKGIDDSIFPCRYEIDFVRVYQKNELTVARIDPLDKVTKTQDDFYQISSSAAVAKGETAMFQFVLRSEKPIENLKIEADNLQQVIVQQSKNLRQGHENLKLEKTKNSETIKPSPVNFVGYVKTGNVTEYPDVLLEPQNKIAAKTNQSVLISYKIPKEIAEGIYEATVAISGKIDGKDFRCEKQVTANIYNVTVPEQTLWVTNWSLGNFLEKLNDNKKVERLSPKYWELLKLIANTAREHGQNVYLISPTNYCNITINDSQYSFDFTNFDNAVELFIDEGGLKRIEGGHLAGWAHGAKELLIKVPDGNGKFEPLPLSNEKTKNFLSQFIPALYKHLREKKWEQIYIQHIGDEPTSVESYNEVAKYLKSLEPNMKTIEATILGKKVDNNVDVHVPIIWYYDKEEYFYREHQKNGGEVWFYISCDAKDYANRFYDRPLLQNRLLHWFNFRYDITGYLHWGLSWWQEIEGDEKTGFTAPPQKLPPGDCFIIYPGNNKIYSSLRFVTMRDAVCDYELLKLLENRDPSKAKQLAESLIPQPNKYENNISIFRAKRVQLLEWLSE